MMEIFRKIKLNIGADIAAISANRRNTYFASCQKLAEL
jgi:hypothetical protein